MSTVTVQKPSDINTDDGKMWHVYMSINPEVTLCGKKILKDAERAMLYAGETECIVCAEIAKQRGLYR